VDKDNTPIYDNPLTNDKKQWSPFFSFNLFGFYDLKFHYSKQQKAIDTYKSFFIYNAKSKFGLFELGDIYYDFWDKDHGIVFRWNKIFETLNIYLEYLYKSEYISTVGADINILVRKWINTNGKSIEQIRMRAAISYSRSPEIEFFTKTEHYLFGWKLGFEYFLIKYLYISACIKIIMKN